MELLAKVIEVGQLNSRSYNDRQGQQQTITSRQVMLKRGEDTFYAEATGDRAVNMDTNLAGDRYARATVKKQSSIKTSGCLRRHPGVCYSEKHAKPLCFCVNRINVTNDK